MGLLVCSGAQLMCSFGMAPSVLNVLPLKKTLCGAPVATISDMASMLNIPPFGMCSSPTNPVVIAATAAKLGVFSPMPCVPAIVGTWLPGSPTVLVGGVPALESTSTCMCMWAGMVKIVNAGQVATIAG